MRILFCFALSALIRSKRNQNALNHQLFSTSGNFGVSRSNSGDTLCVCGIGILCNRNPATVMPENFSSDHKESLPQYKLLDWAGDIIRP